VPRDSKKGRNHEHKTSLPGVRVRGKPGRRQKLESKLSETDTSLMIALSFKKRCVKKSTDQCPINSKSPLLGTLTAITALSWGAVVSPSQVSWAAPPSWTSEPSSNPDKSPEFPRFKNDTERLQFLMSVHDQIPSIFSDTAEHDRDLFELLDSQEQLSEKLRSHPEFTKLLSQRQPLVTLEIQGIKDQTVLVRQIDPDALQAWKKDLQTTLLEIKNHQEPGKALRQLIQERIQTLGPSTAAGFATGLIKTISPEKQRSLFQLSDDERLAQLQSNLPDELISHGFQGKAHGVTQSTYRKAEALNRLSELMRSEASLRRLVILDSALQNTDGLVEGTFSQLQSRIEEMSEASLDHFKDTRSMQARIHASTQKSTQKSSHVSGLEKWIQKHLDQSLFSKQIESRQSLAGGLRLQEVPPTLGIFRGCVGGDCSTKYSFPYPNSPVERVFFVYSTDEPRPEAAPPKGYVSATLVEGSTRGSTKEKVLYVHTINGKRISGADTVKIIEGLYQMRREFGASELALPTPDRLQFNVNFTEIRSALEGPARTGETRALSYLDRPLRAVLDQYSSATYDQAESNTEAKIYRPEHQKNFRAGGGDLEIRVLRQGYPHYQAKSVQRPEVLLFALHLMNTDRRPLALRVLKAAQLDHQLDQVTSLQVLLRNESSSTLRDYHRSLRLAFETLGIPWRASILEDHPGLFSIGHFSASDWNSQKNHLLTEKYLKQGNSKLWLSLVDRLERPNSAGSTALARLLIERGSEQTKSRLVVKAFSQPHSLQWGEDVFRLLIERADPDTLRLVPYNVLNLPHSGQYSDQLLIFFIERCPPEILPLVARCFSKPHSALWGEEVFQRLIETGDALTLKNLERFGFSQPHLQGSRWNLFRDAVKIEDAHERKAYLRRKTELVSASSASDPPRVASGGGIATDYRHPDFQRAPSPVDCENFFRNLRTP
jgi:hypothetical protein